MNSIPCKDCITLAICKARVIEYTMVNTNRSRVDGLYDIYEDVLGPKCSIIRHWVDQAPLTVELMHLRFNKLYNLFILNNPNISWHIDNTISLKNIVIYV